MDTPAHAGHSNKPAADVSDHLPEGQTTYFVADGDSTAGPYTADELRARLASGALTPESHVCVPGWREWKQVGVVPELSSGDSASAITVKPPALPPTAAASTAQNTTAAKVLLGVGLCVFVVLALGSGSEDAVFTLFAMVFILAGIFGLVHAGLRLIDKARPGTTKQLRLKLKQMFDAPIPQPRGNPPSPSTALRMWLRQSDDTQVEYPVEELRRKLASGAVSGSDYVWQEGWLGWRKIADVDSLAPTVSAGPIPLKNPIASPSPAAGSLAAGWRSWLIEADRSSRGLVGSLSAVSPARIRLLLGERLVRIGLTIALILAVLWFALPPAYEQLKQSSQARDPVMAQRTAEAWRALSAIELEASKAEDPRRLMLLLSQMELHNVDPLLVTHIQHTAVAAKTLAELMNRISQETMQRQAESAKATEFIGMLGGVVGLLGSPRGSSPDTIQRNMALGQQVAGLGARMGGTFDDLQRDSRLREKFRHEVAAIENEYSMIVQKRQQLAERFTQKYKRPFLTL